MTLDLIFTVSYAAVAIVTAALISRSVLKDDDGDLITVGSVGAIALIAGAFWPILWVGYLVAGVARKR